MNDKSMRISGFTLVELSIVIIIIGFLIAGVAAGQSLIKEAKLGVAANELREIETALKMFKLKYGVLPGDMSNASAYFGPCGNVYPEICDGDGNGYLHIPGVGDQSFEEKAVFLHLALAGFLPRNLSEDGGNYQKMKAFAKGGYTIRTWDAGGLMYGESKAYGDDLLIHAGRWSYGLGITANGLMKPIDYLAIDIKFDDGNPITGRLLVNRGWYVNDTVCIDQLPQWGNPPSITHLLLDDDTESCYIMFRLNY